MRLVLVCTIIALKGHLKARILHSRMHDILNFYQILSLTKTIILLEIKTCFVKDNMTTTCTNLIPMYNFVFLVIKDRYPEYGVYYQHCLN